MPELCVPGLRAMGQKRCCLPRGRSHTEVIQERFLVLIQALDVVKASPNDSRGGLTLWHSGISLPKRFTWVEISNTTSLWALATLADLWLRTGSVQNWKAALRPTLQGCTSFHQRGGCASPHVWVESPTGRQWSSDMLCLCIKEVQHTALPAQIFFFFSSGYLAIPLMWRG